MKITANGKEVELAQALTVEELLGFLKVATPQYVTVQLNDEFLPSGELGKTVLKDGDRVEFLYFMGGGGKRYI